MDQVDLSLDKGAERLSELTIGRVAGGIRLYGKVHPMVEDLIRGWSGPDTLQVTAYGRNWVDRRGKPIEAQVYDLATNPGVLTADGGTSYCLDRCGGAIMEDRNTGEMDPQGRRYIIIPNVLNLSFLRIVGVSTEGIDFTVRSVFSFDEVVAIANRIKSSMRHLAIQYIKPVEVSIIMSMQRNQ